jgi:hypothetical protein
MKLDQKLILLLAFFVVALLGCSNPSQSISKEMEDKFHATVAVMDMNKSLEIKVDDDQKSFCLGSDIPLSVKNKSPNFIFFNYEGRYIKLFMIRDAEWVEVKNGLTYSGSTVLSPPGPPLLNLDGTWARPVLDDNTFKDNPTDILIRIVMTGEIMESNTHTGNFVSAYLDVYITP